MIATVRTNYAANPRVATLTGWSIATAGLATATLTALTTPAVTENGFTTAARMSWTSAPASPGNAGVMYTVTGVEVAPDWTFAVYGRPTWAGVETRIVVEWLDAGGAVIASVTSTPAPHAQLVFERRSLSASRVSFAVSARVRFAISGGTPPASGDKLDVVGVLADPAGGTYVDGDMASTDTITRTWTAVAHESTSREVAYLVGTNLTIGRFGIDITVDSVAQWDEQGNRVSVSGQTPYGSIADALTLRQQLMGYVDSPDETFVPVTWAAQPSVNGFYRVLSARVDPHKDGAFGGVFLFSVDLERVQGFAAPLIECIALGKLRASDLVLTPRPFQGVPAGGRSFTEYHPDTRTMTPRAVDVRRTGESSVVSVFTRGTAATDSAIVGQFYLPPAKFYEGAATLRMGSQVVTGRQVGNDTTGWVLTNDLMEIRPVSGKNFTLELRLWTGTAWSAWTPITFQSALLGGGTPVPLPYPHTITVLSNAPEAVTIRLLTVQGVAPASVDVTLRRGAQFVAVELKAGYSSFFSIGIPSMVAATAITGGFSKALTGVTAVFGSAQGGGPFGDSVGFYAGGSTSQAGLVNQFPFGFGLTTGAAQTLLNEYFWAGSEKQTVVAR